MSEPPKKEKRKYRRITKHFVLTYFDVSDPKLRHEASQLKNISLGGMCLITAMPYAPGTKLGIELKTPYLTELTHLEGNVLESREKIKDIIYETRIQFSPLSRQADYVLTKIIQHYEEYEKKESEEHHEQD